jgi:hypothetical protein
VLGPSQGRRRTRGAGLVQVPDASDFHTSGESNPAGDARYQLGGVEVTKAYRRTLNLMLRKITRESFSGDVLAKHAALPPDFFMALEARR